MKLNYKRTIFVGFAFFLICSFWQAYDNTIPLILTNKFGMSQAWSGVIMALDNVLALFMLPLFGAISDKHRGKRGRRTPFIVVGTLVAAVMLIALSFVDNAQLKHLSDVSAIDDPAALEQIYDQQAGETLLTPGGDKFVLSQKFTQEEFCQIRSQVEQNGSTVTNPDYTNYVVPARQACAWDATAKSPVTLVFFIVLLLIVLVSMAAGVTIAALEQAAPGCPILRIMPNTACAVGAGLTLYDANALLTKPQLDAFLADMAASGRLEALPEHLIDAGSAVAGCGGAFACLFMEGLADGAVTCGLPRDKANTFAAQMLLGAARLALESGKPFGQMKDEICSPGGTTIAGVRALEEGGLRAAAMNAVIAAYEKTLQLKK